MTQIPIALKYHFQRITDILLNNKEVEYLDYQIPVTMLNGPKGNGDMQAAKRDENAPPTGGRKI